MNGHTVRATSDKLGVDVAIVAFRLLVFGSGALRCAAVLIEIYELVNCVQLEAIKLS